MSKKYYEGVVNLYKGEEINNLYDENYALRNIENLGNNEIEHYKHLYFNEKNF